MNDHETDRPRAGALARGTLALAALWIAAGALFKLLEGSPNDLPPIVRETFAGMDLGLKYRLAIGIELAIAATALLRPGIGWWLVVAQLIVFDVVLAFSLDQESCGCFGSTIPITPLQMMTIDTVLLVGILLGRPWRGFAGLRVPLPLVLATAVVALALPWALDRQVQPDDGPSLTPSENGGGGGSGGEDPQDDAGKWVEFPLARWEDQLVHDTPLARYVDVDALPFTGTYVLWRWTCDHCAKHLAHMAEHDTGEEPLALIRLEEPNDTVGNQVVFQKPAGPHVVELTAPPTVDYVVTTPGELKVVDYVIVSGEEGVEVDDGHDH